MFEQRSLLFEFSDTDIHEETDYETRLQEFDPYEDLQITHKTIQFNLLEQLLKLHNLSFEWFDIILDLAWKACDLVKPDVKHDNDQMDIRNYLKIKKLPGLSALLLLLTARFTLQYSFQVVLNRIVELSTVLFSRKMQHINT